MAAMLGEGFRRSGDQVFDAKNGVLAAICRESISQAAEQGFGATTACKPIPRALRAVSVEGGLLAECMACRPRNSRDGFVLVRTNDGKHSSHPSSGDLSCFCGGLIGGFGF